MNTTNDRRHEMREAPILRGPAVADTGQALVDVSVLNVSLTGLMMKLSEDHDLPASFTLLFYEARQPCELIWKNGPFAGVRFAES